MSAYVDTSQFPLVVVTFPKVYDIKAYDRVIAEIVHLVQGGEKVAFVADMRERTQTTSKGRALFGEMFKQHRQEFEDNCRGIAFVVPDQVVRITLKAVFWISRPDVPIEIFSNDYDKATSWSRKQLRCVELHNVVFDELNLVELPFALLQYSSNGVHRVPLSPSGSEYVQIGQDQKGLPTALAEQALLGLLWLAKEHNDFANRRVVFSLRELIEKYMFPDRNYRAGGRLLVAVEQELNKVAATKIFSTKWYNKTQEQFTPLDASILESVTVKQEGGRNSARILEATWGQEIFNSIGSQYTKDLDIWTWLKIERPLDKRLYRWLNKHLSNGQAKQVDSCQEFAKYKMLMQAQVIENGGKKASSYVVSKITSSIERLNELDFPVKLTCDKSSTDHALHFERGTPAGQELSL